LLRARVPVPRPDPAAGVFETMLVGAGGEIAELEHHLARLAASVEALYGHGLPAALRTRVRDAAAGGAGWVRVEVRPDGALAVAPGARSALGDVTLRPWTVPGGLGPHKWADRRLIYALTAASGGAVPLLVDADGRVLEAAWANVFARGADGVLRTPPADGRILPGIRRAGLLASGAAVEAELDLGDLAAAKEILLTSALREVHAVLAADVRS
jgi:para-aminobenzoate synthetase/4-amino-4-deoxychorismate lyase